MSPFVTTVMFDRSRRCAATRPVVVPASSRMVSPSQTWAALQAPIASFSIREVAIRSARLGSDSPLRAATAAPNERMILPSDGEPLQVAADGRLGHPEANR